MTATAPSSRPSRPAPLAARPAAGPSADPHLGLGLGVAMLWFSLLVLIPLAAVVVTASEGGWSAFWHTITNEQTAAAIRLTVGTALIVTAVNVVMGTLIAWVLVRDQFFGKRALEVLIDIPFALPTIVAGLVLLSLYGPTARSASTSPTPGPAVFLAFLFVTLPFVVRTVQPVLAELDQRGRGGRRVARRQPVHDVPADRAARPHPGDRRRRGAVVRPRRQRVRLAGAAVGQPADEDRGHLGAHPQQHRERQHRPVRRRWRRSCW